MNIIIRYKEIGFNYSAYSWLICESCGVRILDRVNIDPICNCGKLNYLIGLVRETKILCQEGDYFMRMKIFTLELCDWTFLQRLNLKNDVCCYVWLICTNCRNRGLCLINTRSECFCNFCGSHLYLQNDFILGDTVLCA